MKVVRVFAALLALMALAGCVTETAAPRPPSDEEAAIANMNLGIGYLREQRPDAAVDALERAVRLNPRLTDAHSALGLAYDQIGEADLAEEHHRRATQLDVNNAAAQNRYAVFLCTHDRWPEAERYFLRAVNNPRYDTPVIARNNAGSCAMAAKDLAKAEENYRAALALDPANADALAGMIDVAMANANNLQARAFIQRSLASVPPTAPVLWSCVVVERELGNAPAADNCAQQLRTNFPNSRESAELRELERNARP